MKIEVTILPKPGIVFRRLWDNKYFRVRGIENTISVVNLVTNKPIYLTPGQFYRWFGDSPGL